LNSQASFLEYRSSRSQFALSAENAVRTYIAPQLLALDAWEKQATSEVMFAQYRCMMERHDAEVTRLKRIKKDHEERCYTAYRAAIKAQSWWSLLKGEELDYRPPPAPNTTIDAVKFPNVPRYARILIRHELTREDAARRRAEYEHRQRAEAIRSGNEAMTKAASVQRKKWRWW